MRVHSIDITSFPYSFFYKIGGLVVNIRADHDASLFRDEKLLLFAENNSKNSPDITFCLSSFNGGEKDWQKDLRTDQYYHNIGNAGKSKPLPYAYVKKFAHSINEVVSREDGSTYLLSDMYFFASFMTERLAYLSYNSSVVEPCHLKSMTLFAVRQFLNQFDAIMVHASSVILNNRALLFCGPCGIGKSTAAALLHKMPHISDDYALIRRKDNQFTAYSAPFGKDMLKTITNHGLVGAVYYLKQSDRFFLSRLRPNEALYYSIHSDKNLTHNLCYQARRFQFNFLADLYQKVPVYEMGFRKDEVNIEALEKSIN